MTYHSSKISGFRKLSSFELARISGGLEDDNTGPPIVVTGAKLYDTITYDLGGGFGGGFGGGMFDYGGSNYGMADGGGGEYPIRIELDTPPISIDNIEEVTESGFYDVDGDGVGDVIVAVGPANDMTFFVRAGYSYLGLSFGWVFDSNSYDGAFLGLAMPGAVVGSGATINDDASGFYADTSGVYYQTSNSDTDYVDGQNPDGSTRYVDANGDLLPSNEDPMVMPDWNIP